MCSTDNSDNEEYNLHPISEDDVQSENSEENSEENESKNKEPTNCKVCSNRYMFKYIFKYLYSFFLEKEKIKSTICPKVSSGIY